MRIKTKVLRDNQNSIAVLEHGIPMPKRINESFTYDFPAMEVGDSYFREGNPRRARGALRSALAYSKKQFPEKLKDRKFRTQERNQKDHKEVGARIWRRL